jgi:hypothetical protein
MTTADSTPSKRPPRAEPIQPDRPGRGDKELPADDAASSGNEGAESVERQRRQSDDALKNVREGYR